jgi:predicted GIY-YIG superfamily endonuclease
LGLARGLRPAYAYGDRQKKRASSGPEQAQRVEGPSRINFSTLTTDSLIQTAHQLAPDISAGIPVVYFLRLRSGTIYIGSSTDFEQRLDDHLTGQACRTTQLDPPVAVLRIETYATFSDARRRELQIKRWSRAKKEALIREDRELLKTLSRSRD